ncbi:MAG TPA: CAP domain-containing protein [Anaeromyxobacter sp.]|nr:CAP domain-containing protein [Anaeromyxobacter sp.]
MRSTAPQRRPGRDAVLLVLLATAAPALGAEELKTFPLPKGGAAQYGPDASRKCPSVGALRSLSGDVEDAAAKAKKPKPELDSRLCAVADAFLGWEEKAPPSDALVAEVAHHFGLPSGQAKVFVTSVDSEDSRSIADAVVQAAVSAVVNTIGQPRYALATRRLHGAAARSGGSGATRAVLVVQDALAEVSGVPRRLGPNEQAPVVGKLLGDFEHPVVLVSDARGDLQTTEAKGKDFKADVRCGERPLPALVEVRGEEAGGGGQRIVASFAVECGRELPTAVELAPPAPWPADPQAQLHKLLDVVNGQRTLAGMPLLVWDDGVAKVAQAMADSYRDQSAQGGAIELDPSTALKKEGITSLLIVLNPAQGVSAQDVAERQVRSPRQRAQMLEKEITNAGVGLAAGVDASGRKAAYVAEVFIRELPPIDVEKAREQLRAAVTQKRKDARTSEAVSDPPLEEQAQQLATALAATGGTLPKEKEDAIIAPLNKGYKALAIVKGAKADPLDLAEEPEITGSGRHMGVGVAQGRHPTLGRNAVYAVIMMGAPRGEAEPAASKAAKPKKSAK